MKRPSPFRYLLLILPAAATVLLAYFIYNQLARAVGVSTLQLPTTSTEVIETPQVIEDVTPFQKSVDAAVEKLKLDNPGFALYDPKVNNVELAKDGRTALIWLEVYDPETGELMAREPELAIAEANPKGQKGTAEEWGITLPYDDGFNTTLDSLPDGLMGEEMIQRYQQDDSEQKVTAKFGGYYLPWAGGVSKRLTWSIGHKSCGDNACKYAFDFADGTMFPLLAAKGGTVFGAQWTCNNGSTKCTNYLILKDASTTPTTYQIYYHLANGSIPTAFRSKGARVNQGQFIGNVDDTGYSTAHHLHFMVHASTYGFWGQSVDITFKDVDINYDPVTQGGRPRLPSEASQYGGQGRYSYVSGNRPANAPTGTLNNPTVGQVFTANNLVVSGTAQDDKGITKVQAIAYYDNAWHDVGQPVKTASFNIPVDMCASGKEMPDGPIVIAVNLYDVEGNQSYGYVGFRGITKNYSCGATAPVIQTCAPGSDQVALFNQTNFTGTCKVFNGTEISSRSSMGTFAGNEAASVLVGSNAQITIWANTYYTGRAETLVTSDPDLRDNLINKSAFNSFKVKARSTSATAPAILYPASGAKLTTGDSITLAWLNRGWADEFQATLSGSNSYQTRTSPWGQDQSWTIGGLPAGLYSWSVKGRNTANGSTSAAITGTFIVNETADISPAPVGAPYNDTVEAGVNGWTATGLWKQTTAKASSPTHSWLYGETINSVLQYNTGGMGTLTSPSINIPSGGYYLHFTYRYKTEAVSRFWDQRIVQVSRGGGPFETLLQLKDDPMGYWLNSPAIDLSAYAGSDIRIRFFFDTVDNLLNSGDGWYVDNVSVDKVGPVTGCNEPVPNDNLATAQILTQGGAGAGDICGAGDVDYFKFTATAGQALTFDVDAMTIGSALDSYLFLIDPTGKTVLAESDDEVAYEVKDSRIYYTIPSSGTYYLKLKAWDHPGVGGTDYFYLLRFYGDTTAPTATMSYPASGAMLPNTQVSIKVNAIDNQGGSGLSHVNFFWHNHDWTSGKWVKIGEDWDGGDGWSVVFDTTKEARGENGAIYAQVFDGSGNWTSAASWNLKTDPTQAAPVSSSSSLLPLMAESDINTVLLQWNATDAGAGITGFEFQVQVDGGAWVDWKPVDGTKAIDRYAWFIGEPGKNYGFRMRVVDAAGNKEAYPNVAETTIKMKACTNGKDSYEVDNLPASARAIKVDDARQIRTFCGQNDDDWAAMTLRAGEIYFINALPLSPSNAVVITVYNSQGNPVAEKLPTQLGQPNTLRWFVPVGNTYYLKLRNLNPLIAGDGVFYQVWIDQGMKFYVPLVNP